MSGGIGTGVAEIIMALTQFQKKVYAVVAKIPKGRTMTHREVAVAIGKPRAYRAVGNALNRNPFVQVPCHRVVRSGGTPGGFARGTRAKIQLLKQEGALR